MVVKGATEVSSAYIPLRYPEPALPMHPVLSGASFSLAKRTPVSSILDTGHAVFLTSARFGIAKALIHAKVGSGDEVLLPAFNCPAMVSPITWIGAAPVVYRIHEDLSLAINDLRSKVTSRTKALIVVHYFGFHQRLELLQDLCREKGIVLIEDCAHCFYGNAGGTPIGSTGDYAIGSLWKFFPVFEGGCLVSKNPSIVQRSQRGSPLFQLKCAVRALERSSAYGKLPLAPVLGPLLTAKKWAWSICKPAVSPAAVGVAPASTEGGYEFEPDWLNVSMSYFSRAVMSLVSHERVVGARRQNFRRLVDGLSTCKGVRLIFSALPEGVVPYVLPLYVERPDTVFSALKLSGVPLLRWEDASTEACSVTARYARHLLLLPCHQELGAVDVDWMMNRIESVVAL